MFISPKSIVGGGVWSHQATALSGAVVRHSMEQCEFLSVSNIICLKLKKYFIFLFNKQCSVECGKGVQTRRVFCGLFDGASVMKVDDERCDQEYKYNSTKECEVPQEKCPAKWFAGPWSEVGNICFECVMFEINCNLIF